MTSRHVLHSKSSRLWYLHLTILTQPSHHSLNHRNMHGVWTQTNEITGIDFRALASNVREDETWLPTCLKLLTVVEIGFICQLPLLRSLHLQGNPVAAREDLLALVKSSLPNLLLLNGEAVALSHVSNHAFLLFLQSKITRWLLKCSPL